VAQITKLEKTNSMNRDMSGAKIFALWLLRHVGPIENREAIIGDLLERVSDGQSVRWFWREVLGAVAAGIRMRWTYVGLALLGLVLPNLLWHPLLPISLWRLPNPFLDGVSSWALGFGWPLSAAFECGFTVVELSFLLLIEVVIVFAFQKALSWANVGRSVLIVFPILSIGLVMSLELDGHLPHRIENAVDQIPFFCAMLASLWASHSCRGVAKPN
jgi:hypothetical protein